MTPSSEEDDGRTYHPCLFRLGGGEHYILWHDENLGGVHIDGEGNTPAFSTIDRLLEYAALHGLQPVADETPTLHDLEWVERFVDEMKSPLELGTSSEMSPDPLLPQAPLSNNGIGL